MSSTPPITIGSKLHETLTTLGLIAPDILTKERALSHSKWFEYRFLSPLAATKLFADIYRAEFKACIRVRRGIEEAENAKGLPERLFGSPSKSLTETWNARQRADALRLPYELVIQFGFEFASRRRWKHAPRPGQIFGSEGSEVAWPIEFEKWLTDRLPLATWRIAGIPQFAIDHYLAHPVQDEFHDFLLEDIIERTTTSHSRLLVHNCVTNRHLPIRKAMTTVPKPLRSRVVRDLRSELGALPSSSGQPKLEKLDLAISCFGLPHAHDARSPECGACPLAEECQLAVDRASGIMMSRHGSIAPVFDLRKQKEREATRKRVQKCRQNKELALLAPHAAHEPEGLPM